LATYKNHACGDKNGEDNNYNFNGADGGRSRRNALRDSIPYTRLIECPHDVAVAFIEQEPPSSPDVKASDALLGVPPMPSNNPAAAAAAADKQSRYELFVHPSLTQLLSLRLLLFLVLTNKADTNCSFILHSLNFQLLTLRLLLFLVAPHEPHKKQGLKHFMNWRKQPRLEK
jgi:hypothetical protein